MINNIVNKISSKLKEIYGDQVAIYTDTKQGENRPCFFIEIERSSNKNLLGNRNYCQSTIRIKFIPSNDSSADIDLNLYTHLNELVLDSGDKYVASKMHYERIDNRLCFFVDYNFYWLDDDDNQEKMEDLSVAAGLENV